MKTEIAILAGIAMLALGAGSAGAGPCAGEIDALTKTISAKDAGSGPTGDVTGSTSSAGTTTSQHPPSSIMKQQTEGKAASPEDVRRQTAGQPTTTQQGTSGAGGKSEAVIQAGNALDRARTLDRAGKEAECMAAVQEAKQFATR